ncbi:MAG: anaerobic ribonucleoside-triphosphate reductase activating protein [Patescibacteria group bacterium]
MIIGGLQKFSLLDYPGIVSAIIFTKGCNFRCHFCYNPMLVWPEKRVGKLNITSAQTAGEKKDHPLSYSPQESIEEDGLFDFLESRQGKVEGVVITGGEPTIHQDLPEFIKKIKNLGYFIKLDTNGTNPAMIEKLIKKHLIDYIAMDLKAPKEKYEKVTGVKVDFKKIEKSVKIIKESNLPYEFRTTIAPGLLKKEDIEKMGKEIRGAEKWFLQKFQSEASLVDKNFQGQPAFMDKEMEEMAKIGKKYVGRCETR